MTLLLEAWVPGHPVPGGSKTFYGKGRVVDAGKGNKQWKEKIAAIVMQDWMREPVDGPLDVELTFYLERPVGHFVNRNRANPVRDAAPIYHTTRPDTLKLARAVEDALTGVVWVDDGQIVRERVSKFWTLEDEGVEIRVKSL